jgi:hypothetical protein
MLRVLLIKVVGSERFRKYSSEGVPVSQKQFLAVGTIFGVAGRTRSEAYSGRCRFSSKPAGVLFTGIEARDLSSGPLQLHETIIKVRVLQRDFRRPFANNSK